MTEQKTSEKPLALVAEDDQISYLYQKNILNAMGFRVIHAFNGKQAIDLLHQHPTVLIILMDINMPVMDGIEATRRIKALHNPPPVIMVTAYTAREIRDQAESSGCNDYIQKPIGKQDYIRKIQNLVPL